MIQINTIPTPSHKRPLIIFGWSTTILVSILILYISLHAALDWSYSGFFVILVAALVMWIFRLVPEYIPSSLIILGGLLLHIVPKHIILSGFTSNSFFRAVTVFGVGAIISKSRLFYRFSILLLINIPATPKILQKCLFFIGATITPIMSVQSSRVALMAPLLDEILESSQIHPRSSNANALANAAFHGCILLSTIFLTGKSSNFIIYGLLSEQKQWQGNWFDWLWSASFPGLLLITLFFFLQSITFKPQNVFTINRYKLKRELRALGALSPNEYIALISLSLFCLGAVISSWKNIDSVWTTLIVFFILFCSKALTIQDIKSRINWRFLFYFGTIIGVMKSVQNIGIDLWFLHHFHWLVYMAKIHVVFFITIIYLLSWVGGLLLGTMIAPAILFTALVPLAIQIHMNSWLIAFVILMATEAWIFPYQSSYFLCFEDLLKRKNNFIMNPLLKLNAWFSFLKLGIVLISIPFWYFFGILR